MPSLTRIGFMDSNNAIVPICLSLVRISLFQKRTILPITSSIFTYFTAAKF